MTLLARVRPGCGSSPMICRSNWLVGTVLERVPERVPEPIPFQERRDPPCWELLPTPSPLPEEPWCAAAGSVRLSATGVPRYVPFTTRPNVPRPSTSGGSENTMSDSGMRHTLSARRFITANAMQMSTISSTVPPAAPPAAPPTLMGCDSSQSPFAPDAVYDGGHTHTPALLGLAFAPVHTGTTTEMTNGLLSSGTPSTAASSSAKPSSGVSSWMLQVPLPEGVAGSQGAASPSGAPRNLKVTLPTAGTPSATRAAPNQLSTSSATTGTFCTVSTHTLSLAHVLALAGALAGATATDSATGGTGWQGAQTQS
jgi:hypothetical protein